MVWVGGWKWFKTFIKNWKEIIVKTFVCQSATCSINNTNKLQNVTVLKWGCSVLVRWCKILDSHSYFLRMDISYCGYLVHTPAMHT